MIDLKGRKKVAPILEPIAGGLARIGVTPTFVTILGLLLTIAGSVLIGTGRLVAGASIAGLGVLLDALDGPLARRLGTASDRGAFLDTMSDRLGEIAVWIGLSLYLREEPRLLLLCVVALASSLMVPYVRAKAEHAGLEGQGRGVDGTRRAHDPHPRRRLCGRSRTPRARTRVVGLRPPHRLHRLPTHPADLAAARRVKDLLGYIPFRIAAGLFAMLPEPVIRWLGEAVGEFYARRRTARFPLLRSHMARALGPEATEAELDAAVHGMYRSYGRYWAETLWFRPRRRSQIVGSVERVHFDPVYRSIESGNGRIFALPHVGNWEVAGLIADEIGTPVVAVAEHLPNQRITDWFIDVRNHFGIEIILTSDPRRTRKLMAILKAGGAVALVADRDVTGRGIEVDFFGERTTMPAGSIALAVATGADLLPVGAYYADGAGYRIVVHDPVRIPAADTRDERVRRGVQEFAGVLEEIIREAPSQWHLFQPNWPSDARFAEAEA